MVDGVMRRMEREMTAATERPEFTRGETHGDYTAMSVTAQQIKEVLHNMPNWNKMSADARETLDLMATKMARIGHGDFSYYDHWDDLRGYPQLILNKMVKPNA